MLSDKSKRMKDIFDRAEGLAEKISECSINDRLFVYEALISEFTSARKQLLSGATGCIRFKLSTKSHGELRSFIRFVRDSELGDKFRDSLLLLESILAQDTTKSSISFKQRGALINIVDSLKLGLDKIGIEYAVKFEIGVAEVPAVAFSKYTE